MHRQNAREAADITIVTHDLLAGGAPDDLLLASATRSHGANVRFAVWDDPCVDWSASPLTIVRSTWDYHRKAAGWFSWIDSVCAASRLMNSAAVLRWNTDKRYLRELHATGVRCVPTEFVEPSAEASVCDIAQGRGWTDVVIKPAVAASAAGARRFTQKDIGTSGQHHLETLLLCGAVLVQPYVAEIETAPERSLVFLQGEFGHAFTKPAFNTAAVGNTTIGLHSPSADELALAYAALAATPGSTLYARADMVQSRDGPLLMELELIEPDLGLRLSADGLNRLTLACLAMIP